MQAHGFCMDRDGNLWVGDSGPFAEDPATKGRGFQLHKLTQDGKLCAGSDSVPLAHRAEMSETDQVGRASLQFA